MTRASTKRRSGERRHRQNCSMQRARSGVKRRPQTSRNRRSPNGSIAGARCSPRTVARQPNGRNSSDCWASRRSLTSKGKRADFAAKPTSWSPTQIRKQSRRRDPGTEATPTVGDLEDLETGLREARGRRDTAHGELREFENGLPDVAEAEERVERAEVECTRVEGLDQTLGTAIHFLEAAQERVHRDIAPVLRATVLERLKQVTDGRYTDCRVNPESLQVDVADAGGRWRPARLLSHGTAEQLYLLLRVALARHLTEPAGEACPLILDDVVSASDSGRKRQLLETLLSISESTQVILFTHEDDAVILPPRLRRAARQGPFGMALAGASAQPGCRYTHRDRIPHRGGADGVSGRHAYRWWRDPLVEAGSSCLSCTRPPDRIGTTVASAVLAPASRVGWTRPPSSCHGSTTGRYCPRRSEGMGFCWTDGHSARKRVARRDDLRWLTPAGDLITRLNRACTHRP